MRRIFLAGLLAGTIASPAVAQSSQRTSDPELASALIIQAQRFGFDNRRRMAELYEKASALYSPSDPQATTALNHAAQFYYVTGKKERATMLLERAAQLASARDAAVEAAELYIAAAITASETQSYTKTRKLVDNVLSLVANRDMSDFDRVRILKRIAPPLTADK